MAAPVSFANFVSTLADLGRMAREDAAMQARISEVVKELRAMGTPSRENLAVFLALHP